MIHGTWNPEKILHQSWIFAHLTSKVVAILLGNPKTHFQQYYSYVLHKRTSDYLRYLRTKQTVTVIVNLPITPEKCCRSTLWNAELIRLIESMSSAKRWWLWKGELRCVALEAVKRASCVVWQLECQVSSVTESVRSGHRVYMDTRFQSFPPLINRIVHHVLLKLSPYLNKPLPQLVRIADWYLVYTHMHHVPDAVINRVTTVGWPHVRTDELGCLTAQKLDCVTSATCWCIVLVEDKHVPSNAADRWQQLLR